MLKRWRISNFRSIREPVELDLAPLTIFSGPNSSGKSSVIKSLLMVSQSLGSSAWEEPLVLNGRFVQLGHMEDILHQGHTRQAIELGFTLGQPTGETIVAEAIIGHEAGNNQKKGQLRPRTVVHRSMLTLNSAQEGQQRIELVHEPAKVRPPDRARATPTIQKQLKAGIFDYALISQQITEFSRSPLTEHPISASLSNFLPGRLLVQVNPTIRDLALEIEQLTNTIVAVADRQEQRTAINWNHELSDYAKLTFAGVLNRLRIQPGTDGFREAVLEIADARGRLTVRQCIDIIKRLPPRLMLDLSRRLLGSLPEMQRLIDSRQNQDDATALEVQTFPTQYTSILDQTVQILGSRVAYLGPLRDDPKAIYAIPALPNQRDVGLKGEYTAAMLDIYANRMIDYPLPPEGDGKQLKPNRGRLIQAVQLWLQRMGLAKDVSTAETSKVGYGLSIRTTERDQPLDLTSVGVGVSQVLPILVMALLAPEGAILIFEQPEVHLHPKVQSILGDFFLGIIACGKQCIVETHSEHLINRLRRRIVEVEDTTLLDLIGIYFVEREGSVSRFHRVEPNEYGAILEWPEGFFDEAENESSAIMRAAMAKRRKKQTK